jgi:PAS domain S-box-containing protein
MGEPMARGDEQDTTTRSRAIPAGGDRGWALRASERRFQSVFGRVPCGMAVSSLDEQASRYLAVNDAYCQLTGYAREELEGQDFLGDVHPDDQSAAGTLIALLTSGGGTDIAGTVRLIRKDGRAVQVRLSGAAIEPPAGPPYLSVFAEDITEAEQARAEADQLARELARSRRLESAGHLVDGIAHDFNNLLTVIASYASLVHDEVSGASATESAARWEPVRRDVEQIQGAADRATMLIRQMLTFTRKQTAWPVDVDLGQVVNDARHLLDGVLDERVTVTVRPGANLWPVRADPALLEQVLVNVTANARAAMPGGGQLTIDIGNIDTADLDSAQLPLDQRDEEALADLLPGPYVALRLADTGTGMDPAIAERAFEPFFTTREDSRAAGLGLTAVGRIAAQGGGKAWLRSEPGRGTAVTVVLPAAYQSDYEVTRPARTRSRAERQPGSVLVVDDDPQVRAVVQRVLTSAGYRVAAAASGQDALALLKDQGIPADVLLTDVVMPGIVGHAFAAQVQALRPEVRVLFMSGYERPEDASEGWPGDTVPVLGKPFSRSVLLTAVAQLLADGAGVN